MAVVAQLVRALDCGSRCRGFETRRSPIYSLSSLLAVSTLEAIILGIIQGLTEFLPVSSSGHLELGEFFLGLKDLHLFVLFDLVCHLGTLLSIFCVLYAQIKSSLMRDRTRFFQVVLGTLPLFPLVLILHPIKSLFNKPEYLGYAFLLTSLLLYLGTNFGNNKTPQRLEKRKWRDALMVGVFQAIAIIPGVSRSGSTISAGLLLGWKPADAATFSFLLAIPAILGGCVVELLDYSLHANTFATISPIQYIAGFFCSFIVGYFALRLVMHLAVKQKLHYFIWYCFFLGLTTLIYFNFIHAHV